MTGPPGSRRGDPSIARPSLEHLVQVPVRTTPPAVVEIGGTDLWGRSVVVGVAPGAWSLLLFLGSHCDGCLPFWRAASHPVSLGLRVGDAVRIVTHDPDREDRDGLRALLDGLGAAALVVMSSAAWRAYGVQGPPFFSVVDGTAVRSEGVAWSVDQVAEDVARRGELPLGPSSEEGSEPSTMETEVFEVHTGSRAVTDVTGVVTGFCAGRGDGLCHVFAPHATAGLALMETGSGSEADLAELLARLMPRDDRYRHRHGSRGHGADHLLPILVSPSLVLAVQHGDVLLGTWQRVVLIDMNADNPQRHLRCSWLGSPAT